MPELSVDELRKQAQDRRLELNERFISERKRRGHWEDPARGTGIQVICEALDTLGTQAWVLKEAPAYAPKLFAEDFRELRTKLLDKPPEEAYPLASWLGDDRSSPETAALLLRALPTLAFNLRRTGNWSHELAADFETLMRKMKYIIEVKKKDRNVLSDMSVSKNHLEDEEEILEEKREEVQTKRNEIESERAELAEERKNLESQKAQQQVLLAQSQQREQEYLAQLEDTRAQQSALDSQIAELIAQMWESGAGLLV